jgi:hypothetical protein
MTSWVRTTKGYAKRLILNSKFKNRITLIFCALFVLVAAYGIQLATVGARGAHSGRQGTEIV